MRLALFLNNSGHFFYLVGQSTYNPLIKAYHWNVKSLPLKYYRYIGAYTVIVAVLAVAGETLQMQQLWTSPELASPVYSIAIAMAACSNFAAILQCTFYPDSLETLNRLFLQVNHLYRKSLQRNISYQSYRLSYIIRFNICILLYVINFGMTATLNVIHDKELLITSLEMALAFLSGLSNLHAVFYIGLHGFVQEHFCKIVDNASGTNDIRGEQTEDILFRQTLSSRKIIANIQIYKVVHFKLWTASRTISDYFGWDIIFRNLQNFLDMTNAAFHFYLFVQSGHFIDGILRTYFFFILVLCVQFRSAHDFYRYLILPILCSICFRYIFKRNYGTAMSVNVLKNTAILAHLRSRLFCY